ncbi:nuclear transport factor 2 family protein [Flavisolibacter tropicus]|uniref:DUF4440 domain-containing protein n=1 Tax=Flavisolibacter tropicus TaxID=1492898 RepID=A0A172TWZ1_9BACT|nr:nuclear transport factor 2 family protein [Flavisolibacter tropicus]ANE51605.1 hypothetical protein SY85_14955 [Flavisolibacter tropicus]
MRSAKYFLAAVFLIISITFQNKATAQDYKYTSRDQKLYDTIVHLDSVFFGYYNTCNVNLDKHAAFYADTLEFYHDNGGLTKSKQDVVEGIRKNVCGKVTRELIPGSIEVYWIPGFGAIEMGVHQFRNKEEPNAKPHPARFMIFWQYRNNEFKITKVVSLH